jgi:uncharacterized protein (TIGR00725 family)
MELRDSLRIGVMGPGSCDAELWDRAHETGRRIASAGAILVCGGRGGVMEAAAAGARQAGGVTVGILPGEDASDANPYIDIPIVTGMGNARNAINVLTSQAIIAIGGAYGTLSEIALALKCGIPVVLLSSWKLEPSEGKLPEIPEASTPEEAVKLALELARSVHR